MLAFQIWLRAPSVLFTVLLGLSCSQTFACVNGVQLHAICISRAFDMSLTEALLLFRHDLHVRGDVNGSRFVVRVNELSFIEDCFRVIDHGVGLPLSFNMHIANLFLNDTKAIH